MNPSRFFAIAAACVFASVLGCVGAPAAELQAGADRSLPVPSALSQPGSQAKIYLPDLNDPILVWRTDIGFNAMSSRCTYCLTEVKWNVERAQLNCSTLRCGYSMDGQVKYGPSRRPLRAYLVDFDGARLRILG